MRPTTEINEAPVIADRIAGPKDRTLESGLIYGRWYGGAPQECGCHGVPEGIHVPPCHLNLSRRPTTETTDQPDE